jgi:hypothetical protein
MHGHTNERVTRSRQPQGLAERVTNPVALPYVADLVEAAGSCRSPPGPEVASVVCHHHRGQHPSEPLNSHEERNLVMRHEPSGSCPPVQRTTDRRCPACWTVRPQDDFPIEAGAPAGCCALCRRRSASAARRHQQRTLRQVTRRAEAGYRTLLAQHTRQGSGEDGA